MSNKKILYLLKKGFHFPFVLLIILYSGEFWGQKNIEDDIFNARYTFHHTYFEEADRLFNKLEKEVKDNSLIYAYQGMIDYMLFRSSEKNVKKTKRYLTESNPDYFLILALVKFTENDFTRTIDLLETHLSKFPKDYFAWHVLGFTKNDNGQPKEGLETLLKLFSTDSTYIPAYNHIAYAYLALNDPDNALKFFKKFVEKDSLNPSAYDSYAEGFAALKKYDLAIAQLAKATLIDPDFAYGWRHMGDLLIRTNNQELAFKAYNKAKTTANHYGEIFINSLDERIQKLNKK